MSGNRAISSWTVAFVLGLLSLLPAEAGAAWVTKISNPKLTVYTTYDNETGYPQWQRWHFTFTVCGHGRGLWIHTQQQRAELSSPRTVTAQRTASTTGSKDSFCVRGTVANNVTSAFTDGLLRVCVRAGTTYSSASGLLCKTARTKPANSW